MSSPTKTEIKALTSAYSKMRASKNQNAPLKIQTRLHKSFNCRCDWMVAKYPEVFPSGHITTGFWEGLESAADRYDSKRLVSGAGVDW